MTNLTVDYIQNQIKKRSIGIAIGNFDGVHLGHQELLKNFVKACKLRDITPCVLTFRPHPYIFFNPNKSHYLIDTYENKYKKIKLHGVSEVIEIPFEQSIQKLEAKDFIEDILLKLQGLKLIYLGHDFKLGKGKVDSIEILKKSSKAKEIEILEESSFYLNDEIISSSTIRDCIKKDIERASLFLGKPFKLSGKIVMGKGIGKKSLVATANIIPGENQIFPSLGVYLTRIYLNNKLYDAITNVGVNPTIQTNEDVSIETHIFNFEDEIYGEIVELDFIKKVREEMKFEKVEDLKEQINRDIETAKIFFRKNSSYKLALIGKNISHSKSQLMYEKLLGRFVNYTLLDYQNREDIPQIKYLLNEYQGISITSPYKEHFVDSTVREPLHLFAVNALRFDGSQYCSTNTDYHGVKEIIQEYIKSGLNEVYILGDGVMSRVTQLVFDELNLEFKTYSRRKGNLSSIKEELSNKGSDCLVINCCAREYEFDLPENSNIKFWDMNYSHKYHEKLFQNTDITYSDGLRLLELQAKYALSFWNLNSN